MQADTHSLQHSGSPARRDSENADAIRSRALGDAGERHALLFEKNLAGMYLTTLEGRVLEVNASFAHMLGYESLLGIGQVGQICVCSVG